MIKPYPGVVIIVCLFIVQVMAASNGFSQEPSCSSRIISLVPKTMKFHNEINNTKELTCKAAKLPQFVALDERCYLIIAPHGPGDYIIEIEMTILQKNTNTRANIIVPYTLHIERIRYMTTKGQQVEYDITVNRIIEIDTSTKTSWLLKPGQIFNTQFKAVQQQQLFSKVFFEFIGLPSGLKGNELTGTIQGRINVPSGYYPFAVRVYDFQGNSQTIQTTILVHSDYDYFIPEEYQQEIQLKEQLQRVQGQMKDNQQTIGQTKQKIQKKLQILNIQRNELESMTVQQRKLQGTEKSLAYAMNWTQTNLEVNKKKLQAIEQSISDLSTIVNESKRQYQTSVFAIQEKQSQIEKEQLQADRKFDQYLQGDKNYTRVRLELDECERKSQKLTNQVMNNLKQLDRANFMQNLVDIIHTM